MSETEATIRNWLATAARVTVLTGAGMSKESGVPTFRDAQSGLWSNFDAEALATPEAWERDPPFVWAWYVWRMALVRQAAPNAGHRALATLAERTADFTLVTQNVDDLHERAGSREVIHLHGSLFAPRCFDCGASAGGIPELTSQLARPVDRLPPPRCLACGGAIRPGVVWFGEMLPDAEWQRAVTAATTCDLMLIVGTSGVVHPAAGLPMMARRAGARVVEINPEATALSAVAHVAWRETAAGGLARLAG